MTPPHGSLIFADTSFYYASLDSRDPFHSRAHALAQEISAKNRTLISSWEIIVETLTLLRTGHSYSAAMAFLRDTLPGITVIHLDSEKRDRALTLFEKLSQDKRLSLCDVISYLLVKEHLGNIPCLAFDDDFRKLGLNVL